LKLKDKNILIVSPDGWGDYFLSKHHYALELSKSNNVYFLNYANRLSSFKIKAIDKNLFTIDYKSQIPRIHLLPNFIKKLIFKSQAKNILKRTKINFDIVWSFDAFRFCDLNVFETKSKIFHLVDRYKNGMEANIVNSAEIVFTSSAEISSLFKNTIKPIYEINHGVASSFFEGQPDKTILPGKNKVKALYSGNANHKHINFSLFEKLIFQNPEIDFIFLGRHNSEHAFSKFLKASKNVFLLGEMNFKELIHYYSSADVLLICYDDAIKESPPLPHKLYEYLSAGKVVLCNNLKKVKIPSPIIFKAEGSQDYLDQFKLIVEDLEQLNKSENREERIKLAKENSYENQLKKIESYLLKHNLI